MTKLHPSNKFYLLAILLLIAFTTSGCATSGGARIEAGAEIAGKGLSCEAEAKLGAQSSACCQSKKNANSVLCACGSEDCDGNGSCGGNCCEKCSCGTCNCGSENCDGNGSCGGDCCGKCSCSVKAGIEGSCSCSIRAKP